MSTRFVRYRSTRTLFGQPLVAIAFGPDFVRQERHGHARGIIAIGDAATGWLAIGALARGIVALGGFAFGGIALGGLAVGVLSFAGLAFGGYASRMTTAGGVISASRDRILEAGTLRVPFRGWFAPDSGADMEMNGAVPDHVVWPEPGQLIAGEDPQLQKAVDVLLKDVDAAEKEHFTPKYRSGYSPMEGEPVE